MSSYVKTNLVDGDPTELARAMLSSSGNWMQLSASINLFGKTKVKKSSFQKGIGEEYEVASVTENTQDTDYVWTIQPKWETIIQNFKNVENTIPVSGSGSLTKGMWHQYGQDLVAEEGVWAQVGDVPSANFSSKGYTGIESGSKFPWANRAENVLCSGKENAEVIIYIRDSSLLKTGNPLINIDGQCVNSLPRLGDALYCLGWDATGTNYQTANNIANVINDSVYYGYSVFEDATRGARLDQKFTASVFYPNDQDGHPWVGSVGSLLTDDPIAAIRIKIKDAITETNYYPNYYAPGEKGNEIELILSLTSSAWLARGTDPESGKMIYSNHVKFYGGKDNEQVMGSLADLVGFSKEAKRLGEPDQERKIKEAVVAIPYKEMGGIKKFFRIPRRKIDIAIGKVSPALDERVGDSIKDMVKKLKDYVLPPKFDFLTNDTISPIAMVVFEFEHVLSRQDLVDIWQNVKPSIANKVELQEKSVSFKFEKDELMGEKFENVKWLIFKLKQKAEWNYFATTADSSDDDRFKFNFQVGKKGSSKKDAPQYSYNWPYDYFSLVERCKVDADVYLEGKNSSEQLVVNDGKMISIPKENK